MPRTKKTRRGNGEGGIYFDEQKNLWRAMISTPAGKRMTKSSKHEDVVKDWLNEQRLLIGRNQHIEPHSVTVYAWIKEWLDVYAKTRVKPITFDRYVSLLTHMKPIYNKKLLSVTTTDIQQILNNMLCNDYKPQTVAHVYDCLRNCLNKAIELKLLRDNPVLAAEKPSIPKCEIEILTTKEVQALLDAADCYSNPLVLHLLYATGMRISEVLALRRSDINMSRHTIAVNRTVHSSDSAGIYYSDTKTSSSHRIIDSLPDSIMIMIAKHCLAGKISGNDLLFVNAYGGGETPDHYRWKVYSRIREDAGVNKGLHCFRHTHATELLGQGVPVHDVSRRLGHASVSTTQNIYAHYLPDSDKRMEKAVLTLCSKIQ